MVHSHQLQPDFLIEVDGPVGEGDPVAETVPSRGLAGVSVQTNILAFGLGVEPRRLRDSQDRASLMAAVGQTVVGAAGDGAGLVACVCKRRKQRWSETPDPRHCKRLAPCALHRSLGSARLSLHMLCLATTCSLLRHFGFMQIKGKCSSRGKG